VRVPVEKLTQGEPVGGFSCGHGYPSYSDANR
jgi:hypothetical protein